MQVMQNGAALPTIDMHGLAYPAQAGAATGNGTLSNGDTGIWINPDPDYRQSNPLTTVYVDATAFSSASCQIYAAPSQTVVGAADDWFPVGAAITAKGFVSFSHHFAKMKVTVTGATAGTSGLNIWIQ